MHQRTLSTERATPAFVFHVLWTDARLSSAVRQSMLHEQSKQRGSESLTRSCGLS